MAKKATAKAEEIEQKEAPAIDEAPKNEAPKAEEIEQKEAPAIDEAPKNEAPKAEEKKAPVVAAGDHFKTVKMRFKRTVCADYGTFYQGEVGEIALYIANELEKCGAGVIVKE